MLIQITSLEEEEVPSFLARMTLREVELDSRKMDCKAGVGDRGGVFRSRPSGAQFLGVGDHSLPWD